MSQHDYDIDNQTAPNFRTDLNNVLDAIVSNNSGTTEPSVTYANQWWYDSSSNILKIRSEADDAWINVGYLDQNTNVFKPYVGSTLVDTQPTPSWEAGTSTTEGIVSPAKVKAAIDALGVDTVDTYGAIGSHVFAYTQSKNVAVEPGGTIAGSALYPAGQTVGGTTYSVPSPPDTYRGAGNNSAGVWNTNASYALSGTWRALGIVGAVSTSYRGGTLFVRIS